MNKQYNFLEMANNIKEELIEIRRYFHMNPELGYKEFNTSKFIKEFLIKENIKYIETAETGICAVIQGNGNKVIALRADMDALPLQDRKDCSYKSKKPDIMHGCGHDAHTTILLGCAKLLNSMKEELQGSVKLFFEPAEETTGGARKMIEDGVLEEPYVNAVIGLHVDENINVGNIGVKQGVVNAASNPFTIKIMGKGGHGAHPELSVDPIVISAQIVNSLQTIVSREIPPTDPAVITVGYIKGGTAQNIIPEEVIMGGIIRTMTLEHRIYVQKRLIEITEGICNSMRAHCEISIEESYPCLLNDVNIANLIIKAAEDTIGSENVITLEKPSMGVESFAYFSLKRPSAFYFLGCRNEEKGIINPAHGSLFDIDEDCIPIGVAIQCNAAVKYLNGCNL